MIIRHGEKPANVPPPHGVTPHGEPDRESLSVRGWQRAGALAAFFAPSDDHFQQPLLATPDRVFAVRVAPGSESRRHQQTVAPLLEKLGDAAVSNFDYAKDHEHELADAILAGQDIVLVCWEHERIPHIARHIPINPQSPDPPGDWPEDRYDLVWVFELDPASSTYRFTIVPQLLLAGDRVP